MIFCTSIISATSTNNCEINYKRCVSNNIGIENNEPYCKQVYMQCMNITMPPIIEILSNSEHGTSLLDEAIDKYGSRENAISVLNSLKQTETSYPNNETRMFFWKNSNKIDICYKLNDTTYKITETINLK